MKFCNRCKTAKPKSSFSKRSDTACGLQSKCRECQKEMAKKRKESGRTAEYRLQNREKLIAGSRAYYNANKEKTLLDKKAYYQEKRESILAKRKEDQPKTNERVRNRIKADPVLGLCKTLKARLSHSARTMKQRVTCGKALRTDREKLRQRIELNFKPGMTWKNYGEWHIDHVKPLAAFVAQKLDVNLANLLCNLRPEWGADNKKKSAIFKGINYRIPFCSRSAQNAGQLTEALT